MTISVETTIIPRTHDIGGFEVRRALPSTTRRMVGPFIFWDQMGPGEFLSGMGLDVRPHPHIGLSTVTYLFDGSLDHKDSLGNDLRITPGDVNLMSAGHGIVHSERTGQDIRKTPSRLFGIQSWLAQPKTWEDNSPSFTHTPAHLMPQIKDKGITGKIILGNFCGLTSPIDTQWEALYVDLHLEQNAVIDIPAQTEERAIYLIHGQLEINNIIYKQGQLLILSPKEIVSVRAVNSSHFMILGGAVMDGPRYIWWNFVSSSQEKIDHAKECWKNGEFPCVPGDTEDFIPLP